MFVPKIHTLVRHVFGKLMIAETVCVMVVDQSRCLEMGVYRYRTKEGESMFLEIFAYPLR
jgi:hypothetical protein